MRFGPLLAAAALAAPVAAADPPRPRDDLRALERHVRKVIDAVEPSVVAVVVSHQKYPGPPPDREAGRLGDYTPRQRNQFGIGPTLAEARLDLSNPEYVGDHQFGSGLVLESVPDGPAGPVALVLTNYHLIDGATKIYVRAASGKGAYADIHAADARSDLAVLRLSEPPPGLAAVKFGTVRLPTGLGDEAATVYRGAGVIALGHPMAVGFADGAASASWGIVSNVRRRAAGPSQEDVRYRNARGLHHFGSLIQTDARVTFGCSGGGLFDPDGKLIGMTAPLAAITGAETAGGYAIPFDQNYRRIIRALSEGREVEYGFLGVALDQRTSAAAVNGVRIAGVTPGSPAADAGLFGDPNGDRGDTISAIDGQPVRDQDDLFLHIGAALAGSNVKLTILRGGRERTAELKLVKHHNPMPWLASLKSPAPFGIRVDYSSTMIGLAQAAGSLSGGIPFGVLIREVEPGSPAADKLAGLIGPDKPRWLITHANNRPVTSPEDFYKETAGKSVVRLRLLDPAPNAPDPERVIDLSSRANDR